MSVMDSLTKENAIFVSMIKEKHERILFDYCVGVSDSNMIRVTITLTDTGNTTEEGVSELDTEIYAHNDDWAGPIQVAKGINAAVEAFMEAKPYEKYGVLLGA